MDSVDQKIINELAEDARKPFRKIAKNLGISNQTVTRRYNKLKAIGTIALVTITVNLAKLGYKGTANLFVTIKPEGDLFKTMEQLRKTQNILLTTRAIGRFEGYAILAFRDVDDLFDKVTKIRMLPDVLTVDINFSVPGIQDFPPKIRTS